MTATRAPEKPVAEARAADGPVLETRVQGFLDAVSTRRRLSQSELPATRRLIEAAQHVERARAGVEVQEIEITCGPSASVWARILRPRGAIGALPAIVYLHGGGWVLGSVRTHDRLLRDLVVETGAVVVAPTYSLSPEARYPTALEECFSVLNYLAGTPRGLWVDRSRIIVAGDGSGGNLAAALALLAKHRGGPRLAAQVLLCPWLDRTTVGSGSSAPEVDAFPRSEEVEWCWRQYATTPAQAREITLSPARAQVAQLAGLPRTLIITTDVDVTRDAAEVYARRLRAAGVSVLAVRYDGTIPDFLVINDLCGTTAARAALAQVTVFIQPPFRQA